MPDLEPSSTVNQKTEVSTIKPQRKVGRPAKPWDVWITEYLNERKEDPSVSLKAFCANHDPVIEYTQASKRLSLHKKLIKLDDPEKLAIRVVDALKKSKKLVADAMLHERAPHAVEKLVQGLDATKHIAVGDGKGIQHLEKVDDEPTRVKASLGLLDRVGLSPQVAQVQVVNQIANAVQIAPLFAGELQGEAAKMFDQSPE